MGDSGADGDATWITVGGLSASPPVDEAASAAAARATSPAITMIGTSATRLPSGSSSRQLGQKPETGVVT